MAREEDDDALPPLGEDTVKYLDEAKKGKPRNFLLICKGVKLKYLLVKKKPIKKAEIADAKKLGYKGDAYIGVITGKGIDLVFNLAGVDGYDTAPCKEKLLKDFLEEHAEFKVKPSFEIVAQPIEIPFEEEDLAHPEVVRFTRLVEESGVVLQQRPGISVQVQESIREIRGLLQGGNFAEAAKPLDSLTQLLAAVDAPAEVPAPAAAAPAAAAPAAAAPAAEAPAAEAPAAEAPAAPASTSSKPAAGVEQSEQEALKAKLVDALNKLVPQLKEAVSSYPEKKVELLSPVAAIKNQISTGELQEARLGILAVGKSLKNLLSGSVAPAAGVPVSPQEKLNSLLSGLEPKFQEALRLQLKDVDKYRAVMKYITGQQSTGDFTKAIIAAEKLYDAIDKALGEAPATEAPAEGAPAEGAPATAESDGLEAKLNELLSMLEPQYKEALKLNLKDADRFRGVMGYISELQASGDYTKAIASCERLHDAVTKALASGAKETDVIPKNIVANRKKFVESRWQSTLKEATKEVQKIVGPISKLIPDEDPKQLANAIVDSIEELAQKIGDAILIAQEGSGAAPQPIENALRLLGEYKVQLTGMPILSLLDEAKSSLGVEISVKKMLIEAIEDIEEKLAS